MIRGSALLPALVCFSILGVLTARSQDVVRVDVSGKKGGTRFGPGMLCEHEKRAAASLDRHLSLSLLIPDKQTFKVGEMLTFELTINNLGTEAVFVPSEACSQKSGIANRPGVTEACINLNFTTSAGEKDWFTGPCLCAIEDDTTLKKLKAGRSIVIRGDGDVAFSDPAIFSDVYNGSKPTLNLTPDLTFYRQHFPKAEGSKPMDGCVEEVQTRFESENNVSVQIVAAPREKDRSRWDAPNPK